MSTSSPNAAPIAGRPILALDTASPTVGVAVVDGARTLAEESTTQRRSSRILLAMVDRALGRSGLRLAELGGVTALAGPGSFTGLRVGLATALGLHQATGLPATALPTLDALAAAAPPDGGTLLALLDARRGEWHAQLFAAEADPRALGEPRRLAAAELPALCADPACADPSGAGAVIGFGLGEIAEIAGWPPDLRWLEPASLAAAAARLATLRAGSWDPATLTRPLYLEPPAVRLPGADG